MSEAVEPSSVWDLLRRSDDVMKYASARPDPRVSYASARELLEEAAELVVQMSPGQADYFQAQIDLRRSEIDDLGAP